MVEHVSWAALHFLLLHLLVFISPLYIVHPYFNTVYAFANVTKLRNGIHYCHNIASYLRLREFNLFITGSKGI